MVILYSVFNVIITTVFIICFTCQLHVYEFYQKLTSQTVPVYVTSAKNGEVEKILYKDPINENKVSNS